MDGVNELTLTKRMQVPQQLQLNQLCSCVIDTAEHRDVATADIPGAFMLADMDEIVHVKLEGKMVDLLLKIEPKLYRKYVLIEKGKPILYVELKKALYGTLRAGLLFCKS
jgi:hypothetical protein